MVADALKIPVDSPVLQQILKEMPQDTDWDETNPTEAIYKSQGLIRYHLEGCNSFTEKTRVEEEKEGHYTATSNQVVKDVKALENGGSSGSTDVEIKIEFPEWQKWKVGDLQVCKSAKDVLEKMVGKALGLQAQISALADEDSTWSKTRDEFDRQINSFETFYADLNRFVAKGELVKGEQFQNAKKTLLEGAENFKAKAGLYEAGIKKAMKELSSKIE